jgi:hypothetical protein
VDVREAVGFHRGTGKAVVLALGFLEAEDIDRVAVEQLLD